MIGTLVVTPTVAMALAELVTAGAWLTVSTNDWVAEPAESRAVMVNVNTPALDGLPEIVAVPFWLLVNLMPPGRVPEDVNVVPLVAVVVTLKVKAEPTVAVAAAALVNAGTVVPVDAGALTVKVNV